MSRKVLENVKMGYSWTTYLGSVAGVLREAGMWNDELYKLAGMTGMAFHFIVHKTLCPSSVTVYDWVNEHFTAMDRIGVHSDVYQVFNDPRLNTYSKRHEDAIARIKESVDKDIGVVVWAPTNILEFGIIKGYDDEDGVFIVDGCTECSVDPLLYNNLGKSEVPILFYQIFKDRVTVDNEKVFRDSLQFAVGEWNKEFHINPDYASVRKGYDNLMAALERGDFNDFGLAYILAVYADSKNCIVGYLDYIEAASKQIKGLEEAVKLYRRVSDRYKQLTELVPFSGCNGRGCTVDRKNIPEILKLIRECRDLEESAISVVSKVL